MDKNSINQKLNEISEIRNKLTFDIGQIELQKVDIETKKENMLNFIRKLVKDENDLRNKLSKLLDTVKEGSDEEGEKGGKV